MLLEQRQQVEPLEMRTLEAAVVQVVPVDVDSRPKVVGIGLVIDFRPLDAKKPAFAGFFSQPPDGQATPECWVSCYIYYPLGSETAQGIFKGKVLLNPTVWCDFVRTVSHVAGKSQNRSNVSAGRGRKECFFGLLLASPAFGRTFPRALYLSPFQHMATATKTRELEDEDFRLDPTKWKTLRDALVNGRPVKINPFGDVFEITLED